MTEGKKAKICLCIIVVVVICAGLFISGESLERQGKFSPLVTPHLLHIPLAGLEPVMANLLWMRLVQYLGSGHYQMSENEVLDHLSRQIDTITRLDPSFDLVYFHGILFLGFDAPDKAADMAKRAVTFIPPDQLGWRPPFWGAFALFQHEDFKDYYQTCLFLLNYAEQAEDSPQFISRFRSTVFTKKGDFRSALENWSVLYDNSDDSHHRSIIENHVETALKDILKLEVEDAGLGEQIDFWLNALSLDQDLENELKRRFVGDARG